MISRARRPPHCNRGITALYPFRTFAGEAAFRLPSTEGVGGQENEGSSLSDTYNAPCAQGDFAAAVPTGYPRGQRVDRGVRGNPRKPQR